MESHFHNPKGSSGALFLHNHNTLTLHKQSQSLWSETQVHKTLRTMKGALERCSDTAQATITHFDIELQAASEISQAQDQALRGHSSNTHIVWLVTWHYNTKLIVFTYFIVITFVAPTIFRTVIISCFFLGNNK